MRLRKPSGLILAIAIVFVLSSCAHMFAVQQKTWTEMTNMERLATVLHGYNAQYNDYKAMAARPDLTEGQKEMLRAKKKILTEVYPLIGVYATIVTSGGEVTPDMEKEILRLLNSLGAKIGG